MREDGELFEEKWVTGVYICATKGIIWNWAYLMENSLKSCVRRAKTLSEGEKLAFYMDSYLLDKICAKMEFSGMGWMEMDFFYWYTIDAYTYCKLIWEIGCKGIYAKITEHFISVLYQMVLNSEPPCMFERERTSLLEVVDWFTSVNGTFIRVFNAYRVPQQLSLFVTDKVAMQEDTY